MNIRTWLSSHHTHIITFAVAGLLLGLSPSAFADDQQAAKKKFTDCVDKEINAAKFEGMNDKQKAAFTKIVNSEVQKESFEPHDATSRKRTKEDIEKRAHEDPDLKALDVKVIDNAMAVLKAKSSHCWAECYKKKA